jgi:hypothetical protein
VPLHERGDALRARRGDEADRRPEAALSALQERLVLGQATNLTNSG